MAVPKKRTSKSKKNLRKTQWKIKASFEAKKALGKAKTVLNNLLKKNALEINENVAPTSTESSGAPKLPESPNISGDTD